MSKIYRQYIEEKTRDTRTLSPIERGCVWLADRFSDAGRIAFIEIDRNCLAVSYCRVSRSAGVARIAVESVGSDISHRLADIIGNAGIEFAAQWPKLFNVSAADGRILYDPYFNRYIQPLGLMELLDSQMSLIPDGGAVDVVGIMGEWSDNTPLRYSLQQHFGAPTAAIDLQAVDNQPLRNRIVFNSELLAGRPGFLNTSVEIKSLMRRSAPVWVPLSQLTIDSTFWGKTKWGDILPDFQPDACIAGVDVKIIKLRVEVDGCSNIFLEVRNIASKVPKVIHLHAPFGTAARVAPAGKVTAGPDRTPAPAKPVGESSPRTPDSRPPAHAPTPDAARRTLPSRALPAPQSAHTPRTTPIESFAFNNVEYPVKNLNSRWQTMDEEELRRWNKEISRALKLIMSSDVFETDTNFWITENSRKPDEMRYGWIIDRMTKCFKNDNPRRRYFEVIGLVYDEIELKARTMGSALKAKALMVDVLQGQNLLRIRDVGADIAKDHFADPHIFKHIEKGVRQGRKITMISNDRGAVGRWRALMQDLADEGLRPAVIVRCSELEWFFKSKDVINNRLKNITK